MTDVQIDVSKEWDVIVIGSAVGGATVASHIILLRRLFERQS